MRLEDWQKWLETQFIDPATVEKTAAPSGEAEPATSVPATAEQIADVVVAHQTAAPEPAPRYEAPTVAAPRAPETPPVQTSPAASAPPPTTNGLVEEVDVPSIERYLPFLRGVAAPEPLPEPAAAPGPRIASVEEEPESSPAVEDAGDEPVAQPAEPEPPVETEESAQTPSAAIAQTLPAPVPAPPNAPAPEEPAHRLVRRATLHHRTRPAKRTDPAAIAEDLSNGGLWDLVPKHIQTLVSLGSEEVAQNSYKREFRESRIELVERLLDPTLSLEETARLLNVCPTTVRRYTNRGLLTHQRTQGDQRRFKLSDVLAFLESQSRAGSGRGR
jgi:excisionase family DNA binding protein